MGTEPARTSPGKGQPGEEKLEASRRWGRSEHVRVIKASRASRGRVLVERWRPGLGGPWGLGPPPHPTLSLEPSPPTFCTPQGFPGAAVLVPFGLCAVASCPSHSPRVLPPTAKPRIRGNGSRDADEPLRVTAKAGDEVTLDCEAQGSPPPLVTWTKDLHPVPSVTHR